MAIVTASSSIALSYGIDRSENISWLYWLALNLECNSPFKLKCWSLLATIRSGKDGDMWKGRSQQTFFFPSPLIYAKWTLSEFSEWPIFDNQTRLYNVSPEGKENQVQFFFLIYLFLKTSLFLCYSNCTYWIFSNHASSERRCWDSPMLGL